MLPHGSMGLYYSSSFQFQVNPAPGLTAIWVVATLLFLEIGGEGGGLLCFFSSFISWNEKKMLSLWPERDIDIYNHPKYNII